MEIHEVRSCVRGYHVYGNIWTPSIGEILICERENRNPNDMYAVAIKKGSEIVGHVPRKISAACSLFLQLGGALHCEIIDDHRRYSSDLPQGGLEIPCKFVFQCEVDKKLIPRVRKLVQSVPPIDLNRVESAASMSVHKQSLGEEISEVPTKKRLKKDVINLDTVSMDIQLQQMPWLMCDKQSLTTSDKNIILKGEMLTDKHINFAQRLLHRKFKTITGLQSTLTLHKSRKIPAKSASNTLQIMHCRGCHWIAASTIKSYPKVIVHDSIYSSVDEGTMKILKQMYGIKVEVQIGEGPKQDGIADCGLFFFATCISLASCGILSKKFDQSKMREHLVECFEKLNLIPFPSS